MPEACGWLCRENHCRAKSWKRDRYR